MRFNAGSEPQFMDPSRSTGVPEGHVQLSLFEGLTRLDKNDQVIPGVASSWKTTNSGKTVTFTLRQSKWSDGSALTAYDFEYSWKRALSPELASEYAYQLYYIKNGQAYNEKKAKVEDVGVKAINAVTLKVDLEAPCSYFLSLCSFHTLYPVKKSVVDEIRRQVGPGSQDLRLQRPLQDDRLEAQQLHRRGEERQLLGRRHGQDPEDPFHPGA